MNYKAIKVQYKKEVQRLFLCDSQHGFQGSLESLCVDCNWCLKYVFNLSKSQKENANFSALRLHRLIKISSFLFCLVLYQFSESNS